MSWQPEVDELRRREKLAYQMGGKENVERHRSNGKLPVRERIQSLLDKDTFHEIGAIAGSATYQNGKLVDFEPTNVLIGTGKINGRKVVVSADDFTVRGGAGDLTSMEKQIYSELMAYELKLPMVRLVDGTGGGGSVTSTEDSGYPHVPVNPGWDYVVNNIGRVPVVAACLGSVAGLGAARVAASHFSVMIEGISQLFTAGPLIVKYGIGEDLTKEELGGVEVHRSSGVINNIVKSEDEAFEQIKTFLSYLPNNVWELPPVIKTEDDSNRKEEELISAIPRNRRKPFKIRPILQMVFDKGSIFEMGRHYGGDTVTGFARLNGYPVGFLANDPYVRGGGLSVESCHKIERFVDLCQTFHLPIVNFVDQPGVSIGLAAEKQGLIKHAVRAISAIYQATIPMVEIILRRKYGVGGAGMINAHRLRQRYAWPSADWGSLPLEGGIQVAYRRKLESSENPQALLEKLVSKYESFRSPFLTAEAFGLFGIEEIIDPRETRPLLCDWVEDAYSLLPQQLGPSTHSMRP